MGMQYSDDGDRRQPSGWETQAGDTGFWMPGGSCHWTPAACLAVGPPQRDERRSADCHAMRDSRLQSDPPGGTGVLMVSAAGVCGRWGGGGFVAILPQRDEAAVRQGFQRIEARIEAWSAGNSLPMAVSLGQHAPRDGQDLTVAAVGRRHPSLSKQVAAA